jgi:hypothetical protein
MLFDQLKRRDSRPQARRQQPQPRGSPGAKHGKVKPRPWQCSTLVARDAPLRRGSRCDPRRACAPRCSLDCIRSARREHPSSSISELARALQRCLNRLATNVGDVTAHEHRQHQKRLWPVLPGGQGVRNLRHQMDTARRARAAIRLPYLQRYPPRRAVDVARAAHRTAAAAGRAGNRREKNPRGRPWPRILADSGGRIRPRDRARPRPLGSCSYTRPHQC